MILSGTMSGCESGDPFVEIGSVGSHHRLLSFERRGVSDDFRRSSA